MSVIDTTLVSSPRRDEHLQWFDLASPSRECLPEGVREEWCFACELRSCAVYLEACLKTLLSLSYTTNMSVLAPWEEGLSQVANSCAQYRV